MTLATVLIDPILPVFAILAFGFVLGRAERMTLQAARTINAFAMTVLVPILVFDLIVNAPFETFSVRPILYYALTEIVIFIAGFLAARRLFGLEREEAVILAYAGIFVNNVFYALPIAVLIYGEANILPVTSVVVLDSILTFGGTMLILQSMTAGRASPVALVRAYARSPALLAIFAGIAAAAVGLSVPAPVQTFIDFNGKAAAPVALFAMGVVLSKAKFRPDPAVFFFIFVKVVIFPLAIWAGLKQGGVDETQRALFVFASAGPSGAMAFSLAILHGISTDRIAQVIVWTSILTLFTLAYLA